MSEPVTYGELVEDAARALVGLHTLATVRYQDFADVMASIETWRWFVATGVRHATLLAPSDELVRSLPHLQVNGNAVRAATGETRHLAGQALARSGELLGLAHDVLASHLGPDRQLRTPDAAVIERSGPASPAMRSLASLLLTAAVAHHTLARTAIDLSTAPQEPQASVARLVREGVALLGPAARLHDRAAGVGAPLGGDLGHLSTAPVLTAPAVTAEPAERLDGALSRLRVAAYRQGRGELAGGAANVRALTAVGAALLQHELRSARGRWRPSTEQTALAAAGLSWVALHRAWGQVRTTSPGARGVLQDATTAIELLDAAVGGAQLRGTVAGSRDNAEWLSTTASSLTAGCRSLGQDGQILVPTRWLAAANIPRAWTRARPEHLDRLVDLHGATERASLRLAPRAWSSTANVVGFGQQAASLSRTS